MNPFLPTLVFLASLTGASSGTAGTAEASLILPVSQWPAQPSMRRVNVVASSGDSLHGEPFLPSPTQGNVLVVPTPDLPAESLADLTEDLSIMCRIFDKSLPPTRTGTDLVSDARTGAYLYVLGRQTRGTQGLYLDGYGALFFIDVDYPLAPTEPKAPAQVKPTEPADPVWSQTIREMTGQPEDEQQAAPKAPTYDPQRVENLKKTLIKTLAHGANIRLRRPQDAVTLVVGALDGSKTTSYGRMGAPSTRFAAPAATAAPAPTAPGPLQPVQPQPAVRHPTAALLVLRVTKADVDAFAKGRLTLAQFTEKVQTLWTPVAQDTPATAPGSSTGRRR